MPSFCAHVSICTTSPSLIGSLFRQIFAALHSPLSLSPFSTNNRQQQNTLARQRQRSRAEQTNKQKTRRDGGDRARGKERDTWLPSSQMAVSLSIWLKELPILSTGFLSPLQPLARAFSTSLAKEHHLLHM